MPSNPALPAPPAAPRGTSDFLSPRLGSGHPSQLGQALGRASWTCIQPCGMGSPDFSRARAPQHLPGKERMGRHKRLGAGAVGAATCPQAWLQGSALLHHCPCHLLLCRKRRARSHESEQQRWQQLSPLSCKARSVDLCPVEESYLLAPAMLCSPSSSKKPHYCDAFTPHVMPPLP